MRAVIYDRYGPPEVLRLVDVERPAPGDDDVLVKVRAANVTRGDCAWRSGESLLSRLFRGVLRPKRNTIGQDFAGEVAAAGGEVTEFAVGDRVFGTLAFFGHGSGTYADYVRVPIGAPIARIPDGMTFEQAAAIPDGAINALIALRAAEPERGQRILVYGASGGIGTAGVQLARHFGLHVTAVCNTKNVELVRSLGADVVIDYLHEDFTKNGETYDIVFDAVGKHSFRRCRRSLKPGGVYLPTDGLVNVLWFFWGRWFGDRKVVFDLPPRYRKEYATFFRELIEAGEYRAVIDRTYALEDVVDATRYVETQQKTGNVVPTLV